MPCLNACIYPGPYIARRIDRLERIPFHANERSKNILLKRSMHILYKRTPARDVSGYRLDIATIEGTKATASYT